jgi:PiT family inorganic phosphate transporter
LVGARKVAETLSRKTVALNAGQGLVANMITAGLVISASVFGLPVSTTHVATGSLFGIATVTGTGQARTISKILLAWATTLPLGGALAAATYLLVRAVQ